MTTAIEKLHDDFLSCNICTDLYNDPCTLACGHTFCRGCLAKFTTTQEHAIKAQSLPCPNCRQMTKVPHPGSRVEDWVKQIKPSFLIQGLLDSFASQRSEDFALENPCFLCQKNGMNIPATSHCLDCDIVICDRCVKAHCAIPITSHHDIANLSGKSSRKRKVTCEANNCVVEHYCKDCQKAFCQKCCSFDHGGCSSVVSIESMVPEMKAVLRKNKDILTKQFKLTKWGLVEKGTKVREIEAQKAKVYSEIKTVSEKAISFIKQEEEQLVDELNDITERQIGELRAQMKEGEIDMQMYQQHCEFIVQALTAESEMDMYEMYQMCQSGAVKPSSQKESEQTVSQEITFEEEFDLQKMRSFLHLGNIRILKAESAPTITPTLVGAIDSFSPTLVSTIDIRTQSDAKIPTPIDVTVVDVNGTETVVVTDHRNTCIKSFYSIGKQVHHSSLKLITTPWSVTRLWRNKVAVSFESHKQIVILQVTPGLIPSSTLTTHKMYRGLTALNALNDSTLVGGCHDPPSLDILSVTGQVLRSIKPRSIKIQIPCFLCTTHEGNILVSDNGTKSVYCLTTEGDVVFNYSPSGDRALKYPRGITTSAVGDILLTERHRDSLIQLTSTGSFVRDILTSQDGIDHPYGICLHKEKLYVAQDKQALKVFRVC